MRILRLRICAWHFICAVVFSLSLLFLPDALHSDTQIVQQFGSDATTTTTSHWGTKFVAPISATVQSIALGISGTCSNVELGHIETIFRPREFIPEGTFTLSTPVSGGFRFTGASVPIIQGNTYYILNGTSHFPCNEFVLSGTQLGTIPQNAQIYLVDVDGYWIAQDSSVFSSPFKEIRDIVYSVCSDATCTLGTPLSVPDTSVPVIIIPGILGSAQHNGVWLIDPITHAYDNLIDTLVANGYATSTTLFPFPYDWHKSNIDTAVLLNAKIDEIKTTCSCDKVDIVAHSMGGLIARQYIQSNYYDGDVRKLIFLGTPQLGAPNAYLMWEGGEAGTEVKDRLLREVLRIEALKEGYSNLFDYAREFPIFSVQELLPVYGYIKHVGSPDIPSFPNVQWYPDNSFLASLDNNVLNLYNSGVAISNFVGHLPDDKTITTIRVVSPDAVSSTTLWGYGIPETFGNSSTDQGLERGVGDGTVPLSSANFVNSDLQIFDSEHNELPTKAEGQIFKKLAGQDATTLVNNSHGFFETFKNVLVFQILSPADFVVVDPDGLKVGKDFLTGQELHDIPDAFYSGYGTDDEYVTIPNPKDGEYKVITQGTGSGGSYTIATGVIGDATSSETFFSGQTLPGQIIEQNVQVSTSSPSSTTITPADLIPPTIAISQPATTTFTHGTFMPVNITFSDATGVATSSVSFNDKPIAASTTIDLFFELAGSNLLTAYAKDFVNNATTTTKVIQITATFKSTQNDINRMYSLKWMTKDAKNLLTRDLNKAASAKKTSDKIKYLKSMQDDLNNLKTAGKIILQGHQILTADVSWLISH